jgi:putative hemolysin
LHIFWHYKLILLFIFIFLSAFFSGSEVSLFSLDKKRLKSVIESNPLIERYLQQLLDHPRRLLVTILVGNTVVNVAASITAVSLALEFAASSSIPVNLILTIQIIVLTALILIFGELSPKVWAAKSPVSFAKAVAIPLFWINVIIFPITETIAEFIRLSVAKIKFKKYNTAILPEELSELANLSRERGALIDEEHGLINSIVSFKSVHVHEVMTPRVDMTCASIDLNFSEVLNIITESGHSRIPLFNNDLDKIIGVIYAKDLLPYIRNKDLGKNFSMSSIARKVLFVPKMKMINDLMREFQEKKMHLAIVVDEFGGTAGLITMEDILEEILGEIRDESDEEENLITKIDDNIFIAQGSLPVDDLRELLQPEDISLGGDYDTLGGLVLSFAGHIPKEGYSFQLENYKFTVKEVINKRIKKVMLERLPSE